VDDLQWFLAIDGQQQGPFTRKTLVDKLLLLSKAADVHVWNEEMDGWKPPREVAEIAREIQGRRRPTPPAPPPIPLPRRVPAPPGLSMAGHPPRGLPSPSGTAAPVPATHASQAALSADLDPASMLETPPPLSSAFRPSGSHPVQPRNGVAVAAAAEAGLVPVAPLPHAESDALNALNLGSSWRGQGSGAVAGMASEATSRPSATWDIPGGEQPRQRNLKLVLGFVGVVAVICAIVAFTVIKRPAPVVAESRPSATPTTEDGFAKLADKLAQEAADSKALVPPPPPAPVPPTEPPPAPPKAGGRGGKRAVVGSRGSARTSPPRAAPVAPATPPSREAARFGDTSGRQVQIQTGTSSGRGTPGQSDITRVINNNKGGIKICYQRALLRDNTLTHGKISLRLSIGISGRVKNVKVDGPQSFRALDPCIRDVISRWVFPQSSEEYATEFSYVFQGNE
jgi:hypothetical protein